jgi:hypothetical protein
VHFALYAISRKADLKAGSSKARSAMRIRRTGLSCAVALLGATAAQADDAARGLIERDGVMRFNGFRIEQDTTRDPLLRGRALDQPRRAEAVIPAPPGSKTRVIVDMTMRYRPPEVTMPYLPAPAQTPGPK